MEFDLTYDPPETAKCGPSMGRVRGSLAVHPRRGPAIVTCFHGTALRAGCCPCGNNHQAFVHVNGVRLPVQVLEFDQPRDVAWISWPTNVPVTTLEVRNIEANSPKRGDFVIVSSSHGNFLHVIADLVPRDPVPNSAMELQLQPGAITQQIQQIVNLASFELGQSGSPVLSLNKKVLAVVRDNQGRCGLVQP
jgi:hypothetical protein